MSFDFIKKSYYLFEEFDMNRDGILDMKELKEAIRR